MIDTSISGTVEESVAVGEEEGFKLSNRGNKLVGPENPGNKRPKIWKNNVLIEEEDFEAFERGFVRTLKYSKTDGTESVFVQFLNEFEQNSGLFAKEDIVLEKIFKIENLLTANLSNYTKAALQSRQLTVLTTLLMQKIETEQEEYRKLMKLAEFLSIDEFRRSEEETKTEDCEKKNKNLDDLKALCHEHLHIKRLYVSMLRKVRSGAVYALFQANNLYMRLSRINRKLSKNRSEQDVNEDDEDDEESIRNKRTRV